MPNFYNAGDSTPVPAECISLFDVYFASCIAVAQSAGISGKRADGGRDEFAVFPLDIDFETAAGAKAFYRAVGPGLGQRGQNFDLAGVALQQHFGDARRAAEIAVDLERRMGVEHVRIRARRIEQHGENLVGVLGVLQTGPEVQPPADAPAGGVVAANLQRLSHRGGQFGRAAQRDLVAGKKSVKMRHVAVMNVRGLHVPVFQPFLELACFADLIRREPCASGGELFAEIFVHAENFRRADAVAEQVADDLHVHRRSGADADAFGVLVFRRQRRAGNQPLVRRLFDERIEEKLCRAFHGRIDFFQKFLVAGEQVMFPQVHSRATRRRWATSPRPGRRSARWPATDRCCDERPSRRPPSELSPCVRRFASDP